MNLVVSYVIVHTARSRRIAQNFIKRDWNVLCFVFALIFFFLLFSRAFIYDSTTLGLRYLFYLFRVFFCVYFWNFISSLFDSGLNVIQMKARNTLINLTVFRFCSFFFSSFSFRPHTKKKNTTNELVFGYFANSRSNVQTKLKHNKWKQTNSTKNCSVHLVRLFFNYFHVNWNCLFCCSKCVGSPFVLTFINWTRTFLCFSISFSLTLSHPLTSTSANLYSD